MTLVPASSAGGGGAGTVTSVAATDASIVVAGTAAAPTIATGTLDAIAAAHAPAANWSNNSKRITAVADGVGAQDVATFTQLTSVPALDTIGAGTDIATNNVSTSKHGLMAKLVNDATKFYDGAGGQTFPPGHEFDYVEFTTGKACTANSEATANTIVTGNAVTYDGATIVMIELFVPGLQSSTTANNCNIVLVEDGTALFSMVWRSDFAGVQPSVGVARRRRTPSAGSHTYAWAGWINTSGTFTCQAGAGGSGLIPPGFIQITKV